MQYVFRVFLRFFLNMLKQIINFLGAKPYKMVFIVRNDLQMKPGKIASQCAHASVELYKQGLKVNEKGTNRWSLMGQPKIVLRVDSESELLEIYNAAMSRNLSTTLIHDAGRTQVKASTLTVLGIGPELEENIDPLTKHLKLL